MPDHTTRSTTQPPELEEASRVDSPSLEGGGRGVGLSPGDLLRAYYRALDEPRLDDLDTLLAPDCDWRFPGTALTGPVAVRQSMERSLSLGLDMDHRIDLLVEEGDTAVCELTATNRLPDASFTVRGAVVCEARAGRIARLAAYPDADQLAAFLAGLRERARRMRDSI